MVGSWFELGHDAEVGAEETSAKVRNQLFTSALTTIFVISAEIAIETVRGRGPMHVMPISA